MVCACCQQAECETDEDCPTICRATVTVFLGEDGIGCGYDVSDCTFDPDLGFGYGAYVCYLEAPIGEELQCDNVQALLDYVAGFLDPAQDPPCSISNVYEGYQYCCDNQCVSAGENISSPCAEPLALSIQQGPGTELTKIIAWIGLTPAPGCKCKKRARYMDKMGCDWCEQNMSQIIGWLQEEHTRTKSLLPFVSFAAEKLVRLAIRRASQGNSQ